MNELVGTILTVASCIFILYTIAVIHWVMTAPYCKDEPRWVRLFARMIGR